MHRRRSHSRAHNGRTPRPGAAAGIINGHCRTSRFRGQEQGLRPAPVGRAAADDPRPRRHPAHQPAADGARGRARHGVRHHERRAAQDLRRDARMRLLVRHPQPRALPRQRVQPGARRRGRVPDHSVQGAVARRAERAQGVRRPDDAAARADPGHRPDRLRQVDHARGDDQPRQRERVRAHPHDRGPDRIPARIEEVPDQPARGRAAHAVVRQCAARRAARGPGLHPGRRDARPGDDTARADCRRDRPPGLRHAAHQLGGQDDRPHHRRVPGGGKGHGPRDAVRIAGLR